MDKREIAELLLDCKVVLFNSKNPFRFVSGILSPVYCDNRLLISNVNGRNKIVDGFIDLIKESNKDVDIIAGVATSAIPFASWIASKLEKPLIYVRKTGKEYGRGRSIEGILTNNANIVVIEDLVTTANSLISVVEIIRNESGCVNDCFSIMNYEMEESKQNLLAKKINLKSLSNFSTLVDVAIKKGYLNEEERETVLSWKIDPRNWKV